MDQPGGRPLVPVPRLRYAAHLAKRFFGSLRPGGPAAGDEAWALASLVPGEQELWRRMSGPDRRHAVGVARRVVVALGGDDRVDRAVVAAALLHDVGKVDAELGTFARSAVTAATLVAGRDRVAAAAGERSRASRYLRHDVIGAGLLAAAGSAPLTVAWAREHHLPPSAWTLPPDVAAALKSGDDD
ncbi:MAG TPA: hypothetical protein VF230_08555 [Acidimicrobiales bacterium]